MKNKEKFANEIINLTINNKHIAVNKYTNDLFDCDKLPCIDCLFHAKCGCDPLKMSEWANSEYTEPKKFSELEANFVFTCDKVKYYARDKDDKLYGFTTKPKKMREKWAIAFGSGHVFPVFNYTTLKFDAIKWEDEEPTTPQEILKSRTNKI